MIGFAIGALHLTPMDFWAMTPLEFNAASDTWIKLNISEEDRAKISGDPAVNNSNPWADADLVERAKRLMMDEG